VFKNKVPQKLKAFKKAQEVSLKKPIQIIRTKKAKKLIDMIFCMLPLSGSRRVFQTYIKKIRNILDPAETGVFCFYVFSIFIKYRKNKRDSKLIYLLNYSLPKLLSIKRLPVTYSRSSTYIEFSSLRQIADNRPA